MRAAFLALSIALPLHAAVIGTSKPAESLTEARIRKLPAAQRGPWLAYLHRSDVQAKADRAALARERAGMAEVPPLPKQGLSARSIPLHREPAFYRSEEAKHIGDVILSFQTPAAGWSKNLDMSGPPRAKGQSYATANLAPVSSGPEDFDTPRDEHWHYVGTLDNDATNTELHFLAELSEAHPGHDGDLFRASFLRGVEYLLHAQFPSGGWPQVWPLEGGYHDAVTFNDDAVTESAELLHRVAQHTQVTYASPVDDIANASLSHLSPQATEPHGITEDYSFVPPSLAQRAALAEKQALVCILATQVRVPGRGGKGTVLTVWAQQHDPLTLAPVSGRNFEPAALSSGESASVMQYLMHLRQPSPAVGRAIHAAAAWFDSHEVKGYIWTGGRNTPGGRQLVARPGASQLWARFYDVATGHPIFGDRDKSIHDNVSEISLERRNGYAWYGSAPEKALEEYLSQWEPRFDRAHAGE